MTFFGVRALGLDTGRGAGARSVAGAMRIVAGILVLALAAGNVAGGSAWTPSRLPESETGLYYLVLRGNCLAEMPRAMSRNALGAAPKSGPSQFGVLLSVHEKLSARCEALGMRVIGRYCRLANTLKVAAAPEAVRKCLAWAEVRRIEPVPQHSRATARSVPFVHAPAVWAATGAGATGRGTRIGIIDSGIDYLHANFGGTGDPDDYATNDPTRIESGTFPTPKVVGGYDFAGDEYLGGALAFPDPDPLDCRENGHGTFVAGVAAGLGVLTNGQSYPGPYDIPLDLQEFAIGPGIAPEAELYALKVFGCSGSTGLLLDALEWAADPDGNGDMSDRLDVLNISIASPFGVEGANAVESLAIEHLVQLGCVVVCAAGNTGNTYYSHGSPGLTEAAVAVANSIDDGLADRAIAVEVPEALAGKYEAVEANFTLPLAESGPVTASLVRADPPLACEPLQNPDDLQGRIALVDRGACFFEDKLRRCEEAGALAVLVANNEPDPLITMSGNGGTIGIPAMMITQAAGNKLAAQLVENLQVDVRLDPDLLILRPDLADRLASANARGPTIPYNRLKPDLTAPGQSVISSLAGSGSGSTQQSGTSVAAPHVAGAAALLRETHPNWSAFTIKQALMNSAVTGMQNEQKIPYPESRVGAGRLDVLAATQIPATATDADDPAAVSLSFGFWEPTARESRKRRLLVHNLHSIPREFSITIKNTLPNTGFHLTSETPVVSVPANGTMEINLQAEADPLAWSDEPDAATPPIQSGRPRHGLHEASGQVVLRSTGTPSLHVPFHAVLRAATELRAPISESGYSASKGGELVFRLEGTAAHPEPLVSVFELAAVSADLGLENLLAQAADLLAVGVASAPPGEPEMESPGLFFGLVTAGPWQTPQHGVVAAEIELDYDADGAADQVLTHASLGSLQANDLDSLAAANDVFLSVRSNLPSGSPVEVGPLNVFPPDVRDTALMNNSVMVIPLPWSELPTTPEPESIRFRVNTSYFNRGPFGSVDSTPWLSFKPRHPALNTTRYGIHHSPFFPARSTIRIPITANHAKFPPSLLVLHHFNPAGQKSSLIRLDPTTSDLDGDGIADLWEIKHFNRLEQADATSDYDQDGQTDLEEYQAGTDPRHFNPPPPRIVSVYFLGDDIQVIWEGAAGYTYFVERTSSLEDAFVPASGPLTAEEPNGVFVDPNAAGLPRVFYRIQAQ